MDDFEKVLRERMEARQAREKANQDAEQAAKDEQKLVTDDTKTVIHNVVLPALTAVYGQMQQAGVTEATAPTIKEEYPGRYVCSMVIGDNHLSFFRPANQGVGGYIQAAVYPHSIVQPPQFRPDQSAQIIAYAQEWALKSMKP